jgi:DNA invertase Pin-like site-specific DNA recombinase
VSLRIVRARIFEVLMAEDSSESRGGVPRPVTEAVLGGAPSANATRLHGGSTRVALYLRVSTEDQDLAGQERDLRAFAGAHGWTVAAVYAEKASGTGRVERAEYDRLLRDAARPDRGWSILLVWALDRWSREERFDRAVGAVLDLEKGGIRFVTLKEPYLSTPDPTDANAGFARNLLLGITSSVASFESRRKSERVRVAMREIKAGRRQTRSGRPPGRPRRVTPEKVAKILELRQAGLKWREIAPRVGLPAGTCAAVYSRSKRALPG